MRIGWRGCIRIIRSGGRSPRIIPIWLAWTAPVRRRTCDRRRTSVRGTPGGVSLAAAMATIRLGVASAVAHRRGGVATIATSTSTRTITVITHTASTHAAAAVVVISGGITVSPAAAVVSGGGAARRRVRAVRVIQGRLGRVWRWCLRLDAVGVVVGFCGADLLLRVSTTVRWRGVVVRRGRGLPLHSRTNVVAVAPPRRKAVRTVERALVLLW